MDGLKLCNECFNDELVYDERRDETYCSRCGLIVKDNSFHQLWDDIPADECETVENFRQSYINYDKEMVDAMIMDIFNQ